jgi:hypothetical protein
VINRREFITAVVLSILSVPLAAEAYTSALLTGSVGQIAESTIEFHTARGVV